MKGWGHVVGGVGFVVMVIVKMMIIVTRIMMFRDGDGNEK